MESFLMIRNLETGKKAELFNHVRKGDLIAIAKELNRLNEEAARLTGKAVKYVITISVR